MGTRRHALTKYYSCKSDPYWTERYFLEFDKLFNVFALNTWFRFIGWNLFHVLLSYTEEHRMLYSLFFLLIHSVQRYQGNLLLVWQDSRIHFLALWVWKVNTRSCFALSLINEFPSFNYLDVFAKGKEFWVFPEVIII